MRKVILNVAGVALVLGITLISCSKKDANPINDPSNSAVVAGSNANGNPTTPSVPVKPTVKGGGITVQTYNPNLAFFSNMASAYGYTFSVFTGTITPSKQGVWDYDEVYRYKQGTGDNAEVYEFTDVDAYNYAVGTCQLDYWEDIATHKMKCEGPGNLCCIDSSPCAIPVYY